MSGTVLVRPVEEQDYEHWRVLYRGYRDFYKVEHSDAVIETVWTWLHDPQHSTRGLVAVVDGVPQGLAHYRAFARPIAAAKGIYLDDLFTSPDARGLGLASALVARLAQIAHEEDAQLVRWITADDNDTARSLYDKIATKTHWVTYDVAAAAD